MSAPWPASRPDYTDLATCAAGEMARWNVPGLAVGVWQDGHIETAGYGIASIATRQPVTAATLFQIGSITKVFTTTLVMRLVEDGLLDLDRPVIADLPDLRLADSDARERITLRHLLSHSAGFEGDRFTDYGRGDDALAKAIAEFGSLRQWSAPEELYAYCNTGFYLAGRIIEVVTKQPYETALKERLLDPLGLTETVLFPDEAITYPASVGHDRESPGAPYTICRPYALPRSVSPAGGIISTVGDLLRFAALHIGEGTIDEKTIISAGSARAMREIEIEAPGIGVTYGLGWMLREIDGVRIVSHGGSTNGFEASLVVIPERRFALAMLTNCSHGSAAMQEIERWVLQHYRGLTVADPTPVDAAKRDLDAVTGRYARHDTRFTVSRAGARLRIDYITIDDDGQEKEQAPMFAVPVAGEQAFLIVEGRLKPERVDFIPPAGERPMLFRCWGRLAAREGDAPVTVAEKKAKGNKKAVKEA